MKYSLRSLMIVVLLGPPLLALAWFACQHAALMVTMSGNW